jgi:hypothetical protein
MRLTGHGLSWTWAGLVTGWLCAGVAIRRAVHGLVWTRAGFNMVCVRHGLCRPRSGLFMS